MSFPRYPKYKDIGVQWLGEVPEHWEVKPLWTAFRRIKRTGYPDEELLSVYRDLGVIPKASRNDNFNKPSEDLSGYQLVEPGDLAINKMKAWQGSVAISDHRGIVSPAYFVLRALHKEESRFLHYLMRSPRYITGYLSNSKGIRVNQWDLQPELHSRMPLVFPPLTEQRAIAAFLDRETAKIDALIEEQGRLIALLKEKRQALISHAVTKGLTPKAPLKPSGIEWLGDIPEHWEVKKLKHLGEAIIGLTYGPGDIVDESCGTLVLRSSNVQKGQISFNDNVYVCCEIPEKLITRPGDILICSRNGSRALIGKNATITEQSQGLTFGAFMTIYRSPDSAFIGCVLNSPLFEFQAGAFMTSTINQLTIGVLNNFEIPYPPADERAAIATHLANENNKLDTLTAEAERAIELLQERRTALISAAVTGQIDVSQEVSA
ncbi:restriction endonuclease subunit S [Sulfuriroseicoccus oceanibius]|uniref:Restriction endonuclease subunit S n=1 Tax=Sulfuriroseicoccus oceanibius TaxID=2707525 RepID=A0A6B3L921_9BACT|nr:restriction endonuclease subunit S [Sulfuriroseicoccus oceanibius]QQL43718.1 restriction endonuclease subunit S [Sulfuriroseicoccus oceanibius]